MVKVLRKDIATRRIVLEYVEGLSFEKVREQYKALGMLKKDLDLLEEKYMTLMESVDSVNRKNGKFEIITIHDFNLVYDFATRQLIIIAPF